MSGLFETNSLLSGPAGLGQLSIPPAASATAPMWIYVRRRFSQLLANLTITDRQCEDGQTKQAGIRACLNRHYWGTSSETANSFLIGSWGKLMQVRPSRDVDIMFLLPAKVYQRFQQRDGNRQSQLLQEVKGVLAATYGQTTMRGDGQVVVVPFNTMPMEVVPGFRCNNGSIIICDTNDGGRYMTSTAEAEANEMETSNLAWNGNTRALARMMKCWQRERNVPLKSFQLERLAVEFMRQWPHRDRDVFWYDWMIRDFLAYLIGRASGLLLMPGTGEVIPLGSDWLSRAQAASGAAVEACNNERDNYGALAGTEWEKIFGAAVPVVVA